MTITTTDPISTTQAPTVAPEKDSRRCHFRFKNGMRCRLPASTSQSRFCPQHLRDTLGVPEPPNDATDLTADLLPDLSEFSSAIDIRQFLARLLVQLTKGRLSPRRASVLAFICNQLLHSVGVIVREKAAEPTEIVFDVPCAVARRAQAQP